MSTFIKHFGLKVFFILVVIFTILSIYSCMPQRQSKIVTSNIQIGMTKQEVKFLIGNPFKVSSELYSDGYHDFWFYKEGIASDGDAFFLVETILVFYKEKLVEIKEGKEKRMHETRTIHVKHSEIKE